MKRLSPLVPALALLSAILAGFTNHAAADDLPGLGVQPASYFYTGKPYDEDLGAYAFAFRNYDPNASRWTTSDPSGFPDGSNNFRYLRSPLNAIDFQGLAELEVNIKIFASQKTSTGLFGTTWQDLAVHNSAWGPTFSDKDAGDGPSIQVGKTNSIAVGVYSNQGLQWEVEQTNSPYIKISLFNKSDVLAKQEQGSVWFLRGINPAGGMIVEQGIRNYLGQNKATLIGGRVDVQIFYQGGKEWKWTASLE